MATRIFVLVVCFLYFYFAIVCAQTEINAEETCSAIEGRRSCACVLSGTNESISLWNITTTWDSNKPRFRSNDSIHWFYSFNPCLNFNLFENQTEKYPGYRPCHDVAAARWTTESVHRCDSLGNQDGGQFQIQKKDVSLYRTSNLTLEFRNGTTKNGAMISLKCNETLPIEDSKFRYLGVTNRPDSTYYFELESFCCCPGACDLPPPHYPDGDDDSSLWWIFGVVIGVLLIAAVVAAVVLEYKKRQAQSSGEAKPLLNPNPTA